MTEREAIFWTEAALCIITLPCGAALMPDPRNCPEDMVFLMTHTIFDV